jgi:two-component system LytT family response regulator
MRCLIVDDEAPARRELRRLLSAHPALELIGEASDVDAALRLTAQARPEVVFLDIKLAGETGFDFVARAAEPLPHIVFVTAHDRYAVRGFECNALDYLLKPVHPERLAETINRLRQPRPRPPPRSPAGKDDVVYLKGPSLARFAPWADVHHIVSEGNYTRVFLDDGTSPLVLRPLKNWLAVMPRDVFLQVHRTAIVRRTALRDVRISKSGRWIVLSDGTELSISRAYWESLKALMRQAL